MIAPELGRINVAYLTSLRETALDESIGQTVMDPIDGTNHGYREGSLENLARRLAEGNEPWTQYFNLAAVIYDDDDPVLETAFSGNPPWPLDFEVLSEDSRTLEQISHHIPSSGWRQFPFNDPEYEDQRAEAKRAYEQRIVDILNENQVDLVISDSYAWVMDSVLRNAFRGRILNLHPGITDPNNSDRLPGITPTFDAFTRANYGWVRIDRKRAVDIPGGPQISVSYGGRRYLAVQVPKSRIAGVTVHVVEREVDSGEVIMDSIYELDRSRLTIEGIRTQNYERKRQLLPQAMLAYIQRPEIQQLIIQGRRQHYVSVPAQGR